VQTKIGLLVLAVNVLFATSTFAQRFSSEVAAEFYQNEQWQKAADAYGYLTEQDGENFRAWYRLANVYIRLSKGAAALVASNKASNGLVIPQYLIEYQQAQAHRLNQDETAMWKSLNQATSNGFSSLAWVEANRLWDSVRDSDKFSAFVSAVKNNAAPCAHDEKYQQFDFWLGKWEVYGNPEKTGPRYGNNHIEKTENGCLLMEHWLGSSGTTGTSMNYYNGAKDKWVQNWVSAGGTMIDYEGGLVGGAMVLVGHIYDIKVPQGENVRKFRGTWTPLKNGVVRQLFEESADNGATWTIGFDGYYFPAEDLAEE